MTDIVRDIPDGSLRGDVADCTRLLDMLGILGYSGHVGARIPGRDAFMIQPIDRSRAELTPDDLLVIDLQGNPLSADRAGAEPPTERFIHSEILRTRPDVAAVAHFHADAATVFSVTPDTPLLAIKNHAARWRDGVPVHSDPGHVNSPERGAGLVRTLGNCHAVLIRAHGVVLVAESVRTLFADCVHFVENAEALHRAAQLGHIDALTRAEMDAFAAEANRERHAAKLWDYYYRHGVARGVLDQAR